MKMGRFTVSNSMNPLTQTLPQLVLTLLLTCSIPTLSAEETQPHWQPPGFAIENTDGSEFRYPQDLKGPTIVFFWASWCPYCKALMPHLQSLLEEYPGELEVLALNFREDQDPAVVLAELGYEFHLLPLAEPVAEAWGVKTTPGLFLADAKGKVLFDIQRIPEQAFERPAEAQADSAKHFQRAARRAPVWAAQLRIALDELRDQ